MKKAIVTLSVILLTAVSAFAGGGKPTTRYYAPKFSQGWFIDAAGTYSLFAANNSAYHDITTYYGWGETNIGFTARLGRRVGPNTAVRLAYDWHPSENHAGDFYFKSIHFDVMESPIDLFFGYNPERFYTMWLYGGVGLLAYDKTKPVLVEWRSNLEYGIHAGIMNNFRLSNSLDFHIDLTAVSTRWSYDAAAPDMQTLWHRSHFDFSGMAGIMWYLGGRRLEIVEFETTDCTEQENRIKELSGEIARLRADLANCGKGDDDVKPCDTIIKFVEGESISCPFSIFFNKGSYELRDGRDLINIESIANVAKKGNYQVKLRGTCDSATASSAFNQTLSENRCRKIKELFMKYGIAEKDIIIDAAGGVKELTPTEYDRRVLIQLVK